MPKARCLHFLHGCALCFVAICLGCKPTVPSKYIQPGDMEDLLYDYHLADVMAMDEGYGSNMQYNRALYREAVLQKYEVTQEEFDSSLAYYYRDTERLKDIYVNISKRLSDEAIALGASANDINLYSAEGVKGDTANVWVSNRTTILLPKAPDNLVSFAVQADTAYHPGDKMMLNFDTQYIIQDGSRDAMAMLAIKFNNDSVAKQMMYISSNTHYSLQLTDKTNLGIKEVSGFITLPRVTNKTTTMKLLCLYNLKLVRMHQVTQPAEAGDSAQPQKNGKTPVANNDSVRKAAEKAADSVSLPARNLPPRPIGAPNRINKP